MGQYDIAEHAAAQRNLRSSDRSQFSTVRLTLTRNRNCTGTVSVILRDVRGGMLRDTRLAVTSIPLTPGSLESTDPLMALRQALEAVTGRSGT